MKTNKIKKLSFLAVIFAALTLSSCTKEAEINKEDSAPGQKATVSIDFTGNSLTRVASEATDVGDQVINDVSVFIFRASGALDVQRVFSDSVVSGTPMEIAATTAATTVYVVANIGNAAAHDAMFSAVTSKSSLMNLTKYRIGDLYSASNALGETDIRATDVLMTGSGILTPFTSTYTATVDVPLSFPLSKISLKVKDNRINITTDPVNVDGENKVSIIDNKVVIINAGQLVKFFTADGGLDQAIQTNYYSGRVIANPFTSYFSNDATSTIWRTGNNNVDTPSTNTDVTHHFYTAANNANDNATILAIESTKVSWNGTSQVTQTVYYPVHFTNEDATSTLLPGKSYTVNMTLNGDVNGGGGGGVIDPLEPVLPGTITVTITVAEWEAVGIDKEFN